MKARVEGPGLGRVRMGPSARVCRWDLSEGEGKGAGQGHLSDGARLGGRVQARARARAMAMVKAR
eukprot:6626385-Alexandrium_andersonii.AAC.1